MGKKSGISQGSPATKTTNQIFALQTADVDGVKTSFTTQTTIQEYSGSDLNGLSITNGALNTSLARNLTVTLAAVVGAYTAGGQIVIEGKHPYYERPDGVAEDQKEILTIQGADGETLIGAKMWKVGEALKITFPAMPNTNGSAEIGIGVAQAVAPCRWIWANETGDLYLHLKNGEDQEIHKFVILATGSQPLAPDAIHESTTLTDFHAISESET
jgi:hypothetical protein